MIRLCIFNETAARLPRKKLQNLFENIMNEDADSGWDGRVNLVFTSDKYIRRLNRVHRGRNVPTDVLSFNIERPKSGEDVFGEIYISIDKAQKQVGEYSVRLNDELLRLTCHGILHLLGYDHKKLIDRKAMQNRERHFLADVDVH